MFEAYFSRVAFIFLIYAVIAGGYINEVLSCQMRYLLTNNKIYRHVMGIILVFVFIMAEGGWSFGDDEKESENSWASGNVSHTIIIAFMIYLIFLISAKSKLIPNLIFFSLIFILYFINTQRSFLLVREKITKETSDAIIYFEYFLLFLAVIVLIYGFTDYIFYQKEEYGKAFSWFTFMLGTKECKSLL